MITFLSSFSDSFLLAILAWPFLAAALTLPILIIQYRKYNKFIPGRAVLTYLFILYGLGLVSFTLYPMPDNPAEFCRAYALSPQLVPFTFIADIRVDGMSAVLQVVMNIAFFVPLGVFARVLFGWRFATTLLVAVATSLTIELAQLTGVFGLYPCSYRLFDVDDLMMNTFGATVGYALARIIPRRELERAGKQDAVRSAGLLRHIVALVVDQSAATALNIFAILAAYVLFGNDTALALRDAVYIAALVAVHGFIPYLARGWSLGGRLVRLNHDDHGRPFLRRTLFYVLRTGLILSLFLTDGPVTTLIIVATLIIWLKWKKLPYQII